MDILLPIAGMAMLGAGVGVVSAALGVGGGILMVPAFATFVAGVDMNTAKGSSLLVITFVAAVNSWRMNRGETKSPWDVIGLIALGSIAGGFLGASAEKIGVPPLEPHNAFPGSRVADQHLVDLLLRIGVLGPLAAHVFGFHVLRSMSQQRRCSEVVVEDHVR